MGRSTWEAGLSHLRAGAGPLPVLLASILSLTVGLSLGLVDRSAARRYVGAMLLLLAVVVAVLFGSNVSLNWQLTVMGPLIVPACLVLCGAFGPALRTPILAGTAVALSVGSAVVAVESRVEVRRSAPWSASIVPVQMGRVTTRTDAGTAAALAELRATAERQGWQPGTPMVDVTFTPAVPLVLDASVPPVLLPGFPDYGLGSVCAAVQGLGAAWQRAWLLLPEDLDASGARRITGYLGMRFPDDYIEVTTFEPAFSSLHGTLLRPRPGAVSGPGAPRSLGCLGGPPDG